jgi:hypothetical protein
MAESRFALVRRTRSSALPMNLVTRMQGVKRRNSLTQLPSVDFGVITMCGPVMPRLSYRYDTRLMVCSVLPRPWRHGGTGGRRASGPPHAPGSALGTWPVPLRARLLQLGLYMRA